MKDNNVGPFAFLCFVLICFVLGFPVCRVMYRPAFLSVNFTNPHDFALGKVFMISPCLCLVMR